jgi:hypothetical protein
MGPSRRSGTMSCPCRRNARRCDMHTAWRYLYARVGMRGPSVAGVWVGSGRARARARARAREPFGKLHIATTRPPLPPVPWTLRGFHVTKQSRRHTPTCQTNA